MVLYAGKRQHFQINSGSKHSNKSICLPAQKRNMNRYLIMAVPWNSHYHYFFWLVQEPFPVGTNIKSRSGRWRTDSSEENHQGDKSTSANGEASCDAAVSPSGPQKI